MAQPIARPNTDENFLEDPQSLSITRKVRAWINRISSAIEAIESKYPTGTDAVVETDVDYQIEEGNFIINCDGALTITAIPIADTSNSTIYEVTITATNGICTFAADATIQGGGTVPNLSSATFYPARGQWWRK